MVYVKVGIILVGLQHTIKIEIVPTKTSQPNMFLLLAICIMYLSLQ